MAAMPLVRHALGAAPGLERSPIASSRTSSLTPSSPTLYPVSVSVRALVSDAHRHLSRDPVMRRLIRRHGPCALAPLRRSPYEALTRAIAHQQLNGRAAETILTRFVALFENGRFPSPADVSAARVARLRRAGFSRGKVRASTDIARHALGGAVPTRRVAARHDEEAIIEQLARMHGVGGGVEVMLVEFTLGRA